MDFRRADTANNTEAESVAITLLHSAVILRLQCKSDTIIMFILLIFILHIILNVTHAVLHFFFFTCCLGGAHQVQPVDI